MRSGNRLLKSGIMLAAAAALATATAYPMRSAESQPPRASADTRKTLDPNRVSFFQVPLVCPAAPQIGCGGAAKPLLLDLESHAAVSQAWLNRAGTCLAVVWSEESTARQRSRIQKSVLKESQPSARELKGAARKQALKDFQSAGEWYRGADVDRLSEEEAVVIAAKWVGRIREKIALSDDAAKALQAGFTTALKRKLTGQSTRSETQEEFIRVCHQYLDEKDLAVLMDAFKADLQPPANDR